MLSTKALQCALCRCLGSRHLRDSPCRGLEGKQDHLAGLQSAKLTKSRKVTFILSANSAARSSTTKARIAYLIRQGCNVPRSMTSI